MPHALPARAVLLGALMASCAPSDPIAPVRDGGPDDAADPNAVVAIRVEPERLELLSRDGAPVAGSFRAFLVEADGDERPAEGATWILGMPSLASIDAEGTARIDGTRAGETSVIARFEVGSETIAGEARLVARLERELAGDLSDEERARFDVEPVSDEGAAPRLLYPVDGAMQPRNLRAPVVQWRPNDAAGDLYRVRARTAHVELVAFFRHGAGFSHAWEIDSELWRTLVDADLDPEVTFEIDRWQSARSRVVRGSAAVTMRIARGGVLGEVYYWALERGRVLAIDPRTATRRDVVPSPPPAPVGEGQRCIACHTVSRDGRWLFGRRFDDDASWIVDLSEDTTTDPPPMRYAPRTGIDTASFDPTGDLLLAASAGRLFVVDATSGTELSSSGLPAMGAAMPTWSPSGALVAWISSSVDAEVEPAAPSTLQIAERAPGDAMAFTGERTLHVGLSLEDAPEGGARDALPSWTPDDRFLVLQHGAQAFTSGAPEALGALYLVAVEDGSVHRLDAASGGSDAAQAFWPTVSPFITQEADPSGRSTIRPVYWIAFHSRRDYGNALAGTWGRRVRQLWITAVDASPEDGVDPSTPPVWLPGQETDIDNVAAYWAPEPCRGAGQSCADGSECCSGSCIDDSGARVCAAPPG